MLAEFDEDATVFLHGFEGPFCAALVALFEHRLEVFGVGAVLLVFEDDAVTIIRN